MVGVRYIVDDVEKAVGFYTEQLGFTVAMQASENADLIAALDNCANSLRSLGRNAEAAQMEARMERLNAAQGNKP